MTGAHGARNQSQSTSQQHQHGDGIEKAGRLKIDVHVGQHAGENEKCTGNGEQPANGAASIEEKQADPEDHGQECYAECIGSPEAPIGTRDRYLVR